MPTSILRSSRVQLGLRSVPWDDPLGGAPPEAARTLTFGVQHQQEDQWCWAAVTSSVSAFYGVPSWTQCRIVNAELGQTACCTRGSSKPCNQPWRLDKALTLSGNLTRVTAAPM